MSNLTPVHPTTAAAAAATASPRSASTQVGATPDAGTPRPRSVSTVASSAGDDKAPRMVCIIFVAGHNDRLEREIQEDATGRFEKLKGMPKALLPAEDLGAAGGGSSSTVKLPSLSVATAGRHGLCRLHRRARGCPALLAGPCLATTGSRGCI